MPAYAAVEAAARAGTHGVRTNPIALRVPMGFGAVPAGVLEATLPGGAVPVYFIAEKHLFGDRPFFYGYRDDPYRFAFFGRAALDLTVAALGWRPDVVHAHDWHAAPAVTWLAASGQADPRYAALPTVFTIHNLAHQGSSPWQVFDYLGIQTHRLFEEPYGEVNFMARGVYHATMISTVSPTYAREILTCEGGCGLDGLLRHRHFDVHGILNGLDYSVWDPATDRRLAASFDAASLERRPANKRALQERAGLPTRDDVPLVAMVTRLDWQKGLDIIGHVLHLLLNGHAGEAQCVVLGAGAPGYEDDAASSRRPPSRQDARLPRLRRRAGAADLRRQRRVPDAVAVRAVRPRPADRHALRLRPVVRATGGLADTVRAGVTGFTFLNYSADDFWNTLREALFIYRNDPESWRAIQVKGMTSDFSWESSARAYQQLYGWAIARMRGG